MLHGKLEVNGKPVAAWQASRTTEIEDTNARHPYDCQVTWENGRTVRFQLRHVYSEGATVLAAKILTRASKLEWELP